MVKLGTEGKDNSSEQSALQHPKEEPEAQRQTARMFQNDLFSLLPRGPTRCPLAVGFGLRSKTQQMRAVGLVGRRRLQLKPTGTACHSQSQFRLLQLGSPVLAASFKDADTVLPVAALPCPVPRSCFIRWKQAMKRRTLSCVSSRRVPLRCVY